MDQKYSEQAVETIERLLARRSRRFIVQVYKEHKHREERHDDEATE